MLEKKKGTYRIKKLEFWLTDPVNNCPRDDNNEIPSCICWCNLQDVAMRCTYLYVVFVTGCQCQEKTVVFHCDKVKQYWRKRNMASTSYRNNITDLYGDHGTDFPTKSNSQKNLFCRLYLE